MNQPLTYGLLPLLLFTILSVISAVIVVGIFDGKTLTGRSEDKIVDITQ